MNKQEHSIVLASASSRRLELLKQIGIDCRVEPADIDESVRCNESVVEYVLRLAEEKSCAIYQPGTTKPVLAADTSISFNGEILGKPIDADDAFSMLTMLSGRQHEVLTGVSVRSPIGLFSAICRTTVRLRTLNAEQIRAYCDFGEPLGKAGSYGIQGLGGILVEAINGSYSNVVGLPLYETSLLLEKSNVPVLGVD